MATKTEALYNRLYGSGAPQPETEEELEQDLLNWHDMGWLNDEQMADLTDFWKSFN